MLGGRTLRDQKSCTTSRAPKGTVLGADYKLHSQLHLVLLDTAAATATPVRRGLRPREVLVKHFVTMIRASISITAVTLSLGSILYFLGLRGFAWEYWYKLHRWWYSLSKTSRPTGLAPFVPLVSRFVLQAIFLSLLWNFVNKAFSLYVAQEPLKNDQPITQDSKDPNGTLLNGLKSKKDAVKVRNHRTGALGFC